MEVTIIKAKARIGRETRQIIVWDCPYCHREHRHNFPIGKGKRTAECLQGEYLLDFDEEKKEGSDDESKVKS